MGVQSTSRIGFFAFPLALATALSCRAAPAETPPAETCADRMKEVVAYLWELRAEAPAAIRPGLKVVDQEWEPVDEEPGFKLGEASVRTLPDAPAVDSFLNDLRERAGTRDAEVGVPRDASGTEEATRVSRASGVEKGIFCSVILEVGDVEHVLVLQFDPQTGRALAAYEN